MSKNDAVLVRDEGQVQQIPTNDEALIRSTLSPEDSRSQAVASFLNTAYEKASTLQLTPEESAKLLAKFDDECVLRGAGGDADLIYISHIHLSNRLNEVLGIGQWAMLRRNIRQEDTETAKGQKMSRIYFEGVLVVRGTFLCEAIGTGNYYPHNPNDDYSGALEKAMSNCLTRLCKRLGIGSQVWDRAYCNRWLKIDNERVAAEQEERRKTERAAAIAAKGKPVAAPAVATATPPAAPVGTPPPAEGVVDGQVLPPDTTKKRGRPAKVEATPTPAPAVTAEPAATVIDYTIMPCGKFKGMKFSNLDAKVLGHVIAARVITEDELAKAKATLDTTTASANDRALASSTIGMSAITEQHKDEARKALASVEAGKGPA